MVVVVVVNQFTWWWWWKGDKNVAVVLVKQKRCGGGADIKTIKYCGGDGGAMINNGNVVVALTVLLSRQNEWTDQYFFQVLVKQLENKSFIDPEKKNLSKEPNNRKIVHVLILTRFTFHSWAKHYDVIVVNEFVPS